MKPTPIFFGVGVVVALGLLIVAGIHGWTRSYEIANIPCLGCLGLDPVPTGLEDFRFDTVSNYEHHEIVLEALKTHVVFLHFRMDVCPGCDEIEPTIFSIENEYKNTTKFFHINIQQDYEYNEITLPESISFEIYSTYDTKYETKGSPGGVPMMTIITLNQDNDGKVRPYFNSLYGPAYTRDDLTKVLNLALDYHEDHADQF